MKPSTIFHTQIIEPSELIITPRGAIYHLNLRPEEISDTIIVVGDQNRVKRVSSHFDTIEHIQENREFVTHTGTLKGKKLTVLSTGIGCDNIDIVVNELDALVNIDLETRKIKETHTPLNIIRLGTSGALQEDIPVDSFVLSSYGLGFDGLMNFYETNYEQDEIDLKRAFVSHTKWSESLNPPYFVSGSNTLKDKIKVGMHVGITATAHGFYGPQGRKLRLNPKVQDLNEVLTTFKFENQRITNFEMETSALYGLSASLGHQACTVCAIIANRFKREYSADYKKTVDLLIEDLLSKLTT